VNTRFTVALVAIFGFVIRFLRLGAIENDHYVYLARAHQMLHGDWPVRDFVDPGFTLGYLLSFAAAAVAGPSLLVEAVLSVAIFAVALGIIYALTRRASGSMAAALLAVAVLLLFPPRLYNSSKMLVPIVAIAIAWAYSDRPSRVRAAALGAWTAIAFLFRLDYGAFMATVTGAMLAAQHWGDWRTLIGRAVTTALVAIAIVGPWLVYVQVQQGLVEYVASAMRFSVAERDRTVSHWAPIYYVMTAVPVVALLIGFRGTPYVSRTQVLFAALLVLVSDLVLLRDAPGSRLPDVYGTTAVVAAITIGACQPQRERAARSWTRALVTGMAVVLVAASWLLSRAPAGSVRPLSRWQQVVTRLRETRPEIMPDPQRAPLVDYLRRCTPHDARLFVGGFGPELPVLTDRAFAAGLPDWMRGYYTDPADVARARAQLARERVGAAVMLDSGDAFTASWPALAADLRARGLVPEHLELASQDVELWVMPSGRRDSATGLPCTPAE